MNELQSLSQIFQNRLFRIPDYQRGYAWQDLQLRDFWEDVVNLQPDRYHYTGLLSMKVLKRADFSRLGNDVQWLINNGYRPYHIVDGQQRLTTFIVLLNELVDLVCSLSDNEGKPEDSIYIGYECVKDIKAKYICRKRPPDGIIVTYIFGYENDNPSAEYLKHRIFNQPFGGTIKETYYTKNLKYAKEFFSTELRAFLQSNGAAGIAELYQKLTLRLMFNIHEIEDAYDVFAAFETMNNRGKKLTNLELLKNRLIYLSTLYGRSILDDDDAAALRELINKAWREVYYQLGRNENDLLLDDEFLRAHWIIYFRYSRKRGDDYIKFLLRKFSHKAIYGSVQPASPVDADTEEPFYDPDADDDDTEEPTESSDLGTEDYLHPREIRDYVQSLNEMAEYWYYTFYPEKCAFLSEEEQVWIDKLNRIGISYFRPLIAVSLVQRLNISAVERLDFYKAAERFIFVNFRMAMYQSSYKSSDYYRKSRELYAGEINVAAITADLNMTTDANVQDSVRIFLTRMNRRFVSADGFYSWRDLRYVLYEYEYSLCEKRKLEKLSWAVLTKVVKDKITVEHILPQTPTKAYWRNHFRQFTPSEIKQLSASLGNMLPLSQSINSSLQNDSFDEKKARGYTDGCHCEVEVSKETVWDAEHIYARGMKLLHFMEKRWAIHFESTAQKEELLHIGFVHDGRLIPEETLVEPAEGSTVTGNRSEYINTQILNWLREKERADGIHIDYQKSDKRFTRYTTDATTEVLPDSLSASSGWGTKNHYFYEINHFAGKKIELMFTVTVGTAPSSIKYLLDNIAQRFAPQTYKADWTWCRLFSCPSVSISEATTDEKIEEILNEQYVKARRFERELVAYINSQCLPPLRKAEN